MDKNQLLAFVLVWNDTFVIGVDNDLRYYINIGFLNQKRLLFDSFNEFDPKEELVTAMRDIIDCKKGQIFDGFL